MDRKNVICLILIFFNLTVFGQKSIIETVSAENKSAGFVSIYLGTMIPSRISSTLGFHPVVGASIGARKGKYSYSITGEGRFADTRQGYTINNKDQDTLMLTNEFLGALIGFEIGYNVLQKESWSFDAVAGGGYELVRTILYPENYTDDVTINTYNINIGLSFRKTINDNTYLGLTAKYNFVDYTLANQSDLSENYFSVTVQLGYNVVRNNQ